MKGDLTLARVRLSGSLIDIEALRRQSRRLLWHLFSFETAFILYLYGGAYKADSRLGGHFPIDPAIIFVAITAAVGLLIVWREGLYRPGLYYLSFYLLFAFWAVLSTLWSPSRTYAHDEALIIFFQNSWALICGAIIVANSRVRVYRFLLLFLIFAAIISINWLSDYNSIFAYVNNVAAYQDSGRVFTMGMIVAFTGFVFLKGLRLDRLVLIGLFLLYSLALLTAGARSFTLAVFLALCIPGLISTRFAAGRLLIHRSQPIVLLTVGAALVGVAALYASGRLPWTLVRMTDLFSDQGGSLGALNNLRFAFYTFALELWTRAPLFGVGLGGFGPLYFHLDGRFYPHNIVLQILSELGLVGFILFVPIILIPLRRLGFARLWNEPVLLCVFMIVINNFIYSLASGDLAIGVWLGPAGMLMMRPLSDELAGRAVAHEGRSPARVETG